MGFRKLAVTVLMMVIGTITLLMGAIDQETFKWILTSSGISYLTMNAVSKFAGGGDPQEN
jgi:hypothetical protein